MRKLVTPRSGDALGAWKIFNAAEDGGGIAIRPAADIEDRDFDSAVILAHRAMFPERVAALMLHPQHRIAIEIVQPMLPHILPAFPADDLGVRRQRTAGEEIATPIERVVEQAAAHVMHIIGVTIDGGGNRDHGFQRRRTPRRDLQAVEAAPRNTDHADRAVAPILRRQPGDDLHRIILFAAVILVLDQAFAIARTGNVNARRGVTVSGEPVMRLVIADAGTVAAAVGDILEDTRDFEWPVPRQQQPGRQLAAIRHGDPGDLDILDLIAVIGDFRSFACHVVSHRL